MTTVNKEMRKYGLHEESYHNFKEWYYKTYNRKIHDEYGELYKFIRHAEGSILEQILDELDEWVKYNEKIYKDLVEIESYLDEKLNHRFQSLNEFGYIYEIRNLSIGDSSSFYDEVSSETYSISTNTFAFDISLSLHGDSFMDVKKSSAYGIVVKSLNELIEKEIKKSNVSGNLAIFEKSVKIVFGDIFIQKTNNHPNSYALVLKMGIKVL